MATGFEEILSIHRLSEEDLNQICSKEHRDEFIKRIKDWKVVGATLGFTQEQLDRIDGGDERDDQKKTTLFIRWSMRVEKEATYLNLARFLFAGGLADLLQELCVLLSEATPTIPAGISHVSMVAMCSTYFYHHLTFLDQPSGIDDSNEVEPRLPMEKEMGNQMTGSALGEGALKLYRPESQMSESAPDDLHKSLTKSGTVIYDSYRPWGRESYEAT